MPSLVNGLDDEEVDTPYLFTSYQGHEWRISYLLRGPSLLQALSTSTPPANHRSHFHQSQNASHGDGATHGARLSRRTSTAAADDGRRARARHRSTSEGTPRLESQPQQPESAGPEVLGEHVGALQLARRQLHGAPAPAGDQRHHPEEDAA